MKKFLTLTKSLQELGVNSYKELWQKAQGDGFDGLSIHCPVTITKSGDNSFHAIFSTEDEDRHGDVVRQEWDLKGFNKNPVFLDSHDYSSITSIIGKIKHISVDGKKLQGDIEFALSNPKGALARDLAEGGFLNTTSVGFIPREFSDKGEIIKSELLEVSAVSVPANPKAQFEKSAENPDEELLCAAGCGTALTPDNTVTLETEDPETFEAMCRDCAGITEEEEEEDEAEVAELTIDHTGVALKAVKELQGDKERYLKTALIAVHKLNDPSNRKRKALQAIRRALKSG